MVCRGGKTQQAGGYNQKGGFYECWETVPYYRFCKKSGHYEKQDESQVIRNLRMVGRHVQPHGKCKKQSPGQRMFTVGVCKRSQDPWHVGNSYHFGHMPGLDDLEVIGAKSNGYGTQNRYPRTDPQCKKEKESSQKG